MRFLIGVDQQVAFKMTESREGCFTNITFVRFLTGVDRHVTGEVARLSE